MQTTLLTIAVAVILALVAALVGPFFIDWSTYRSLFEREASRLTGLEVHVKGGIDARLLPSPGLQLDDIQVGPGGDGILRARSLTIEFALAPLLRGEWRANDMRIVGPELHVGIDEKGQFAVPAVALDMDPDALSIDRLEVQDGKAFLTDATSGSAFTLDKLWFNGDLRSLAGPIKGEGAATVDGALYPFRISTGRANADGALRLHINVDPTGTPLNIEADGTVSAADGKPQFQGTWSVARPVGIASPGSAAVVTQPWKFGGKIKLTPASALMEQVDFNYGSDADAIKLNGTAELAFGAHPHFEGVLSARQIDLDKLAGPSAGEAAGAPPAATIRRLMASAGAAFRPPFPIQLGLGIDLVTLGGTDLQSLRGDISSASGGWTLDRFEFRAPGLTDVRLSGRLGIKPSGVEFTGPADVASNDPNALAAWLEGRKETGRATPRPLRIRGDITLGNEKIAIERLNAGFNRGTITGRFAYDFGGKGGGRVEAALSAPDLDVDAVSAFGKALLAGSTAERPREVALSLDIGRASYAGIEAGKTNVKLQYDAKGLAIEQLAVDNFGGANVTARGQIGLTPAPHGSVTLGFDARELTGINAILARYMPQLAERLNVVAPVLAPVKLLATLKLDNEKAGNTAALSVTGTAGVTRISFNGEGVADFAALNLSSFRMLAQIDATDAGSLAALTGANRVVSVGQEPGMMRLTLSGNPFGDMALTTTLSANSLAATASGTVRVTPGNWPSGNLNFNVTRADFAPVQPNGGKLPVAVTGRVISDGKQAKFEDISAVIAGSKARGKLSASLTAPSRIDGSFDVDTLDVAPLLASAAGLPKGAKDWAWSSVPFDSAMQNAVTGQIALNAMRADLTPGISARQFHGRLTLGSDEAALDDISGSVAGGTIAGKIGFKNGADGVTMNADMSLDNADAAALLPAVARPPVSGRANAQIKLEGAGRSPATLVGSLHGEGKIALSDGQIAGLDPRAFAAVTRAVDQGLPVEGSKIKSVAERALASGQLNIKSAQGALAIGAGQIRLADAKASGDGADLAMSGVFDLTNGVLNARLVLTGDETAAGARPDIFLALNGPLSAPGKTIDVSGLTGWLTLRAIDQQSKKLDAIEAAPRDEPAAAPMESKVEEKPKESNTPKKTPAQPRAAANPPQPRPAAPALPPPISILPRANPPPPTR
ncbi:MAG TPA: AsmA family protein [Pseudolabrys sp.]|nr:AsmA family protein [Pseudolabrys sp.]